MLSFIERINFIAECRASRLGLWECPPFLFIIMGIINIITMVAVWIFARRIVEEPQTAALIVIFISALIFAIGNFLITGFNKIAEANRIKSDFLNLVSHQLRTPLSVFKWTLELLEKGNTDTKQLNQYLTLLGEHSDSMARIINLLLDVSRIEAGRFVMLREAISLERLTAETIRSLEPYAKSSGVTVLFENRSGAQVFGDTERMRMVIQNLLDNAIRYSSPAGKISVSIFEPSRGQVEWRISDEGVGIPKYQQKYIFQKFFRAANGLMQQGQGTGLGLYIARAIIKELKGDIEFESQEGKGSTFWFRLPIYK